MEVKGVEIEKSSVRNRIVVSVRESVGRPEQAS
jgi:hypothetical protein